MLSFPARSYASPSILVLLSMLLTGCAAVSVTPEPISPPNPSVAANAIEAEPTPPAQIAVRDFVFDPSSVTENRSPIHRATDLGRGRSAHERRLAIGRDAAAELSERTAKRLDKLGLRATRI